MAHRRHRRKSGSRSRHRGRHGSLFSRIGRDLNKLRDAIFPGDTTSTRDRRRKPKHRKSAARRKRASHRRKAPRRRRARDWKGDPRGHAKASKRGWRRVAKKGWRPKARSRKSARRKR